MKSATQPKLHFCSAAGHTKKTIAQLQINAPVKRTLTAFAAMQQQVKKLGYRLLFFMSSPVVSLTSAVGTLGDSKLHLHHTQKIPTI